RQPHPGMPEVRIDVHAGDGEQGEAIIGVGQPLDGLAEDLPKDLVDPRRSGIAPGRAHVPSSSQWRSAVTTSTSGKDQTKRSTWSSTSTTWPAVEETTAMPRPARCQRS